MDFRAQWAKDAGTIEAAIACCKDPIMEPKYDGWRCIVIRTATGVDIYNPSRSASVAPKRYTGQLPELEAQLMKLPVGTILDGELIAMKLDVDSGQWTNDFFRIHTVMRSKSTIPAQREGIQLVAFDCPMPNVAKLPLEQRRDYIKSLIEACDLQGSVSLTVQMEATQKNHESVLALGFEGTVVKDAEHGYAFGKRGHGWFKIKSTQTIEGVVMALPVNGKNQYTGQVGHMVIGQIRADELIERTTINAPDQKQRREMTDHPERYIGRVAEIKVYGWHADGAPRHPTFLRWRDGDKDPADCVWTDAEATL